MKAQLRMAFEAEMNAARAAYAEGALDGAFRHLERAHILGQRHTVPHVVSRIAAGLKVCRVPATAR